MHRIQAKSILSSSNGINVYRGCTHGCIYCDSRSICYGIDHEFTDVAVKENAPQLLEAALRSKRKRCMIGTGAMSDPYMPLEKELRITRQCLELIKRYDFGAAVQTKSDLVLRDIDLLSEINHSTKAVVQMTLTTADDELCRIIEPNVCVTSRRFEVLCEMKKAGIPTVMWMCPILPFINDTEENILALVDYADRAGCKGILSFGIGMTLRDGDRQYYYAALDRHFPQLKERYIQRYRDSYELPSPDVRRLWRVFTSACEKAGIEYDTDRIFSYLHEFPENEQLSLF
ncbi:MAG: radical SAM protein [Oscillospiraceae bacterium]|nr:radical SAM protein [Oscillospiraceae bacterium]